MEVVFAIMLFLCISVPLCVTFILTDFIKSLDIGER